MHFHLVPTALPKKKTRHQIAVRVLSISISSPPTRSIKLRPLRVLAMGMASCRRTTATDVTY